MSDPNFAVGPHAVCVRNTARLEAEISRLKAALTEIANNGYTADAPSVAKQALSQEGGEK